MREEANEVFALIGAAQTIVANFPMGLLSRVATKTYTSAYDFLIDCLKYMGIGDVEIINFILKDLFDINIDIRNRDKIQKWLDTADEDISSSRFVESMESAIKALISVILSEILSCEIHPLIPQKAFNPNAGFEIPISSIDLLSMLNVCPTSELGKLLYDNIPSGATPSEMKTSKDLNAFMWYCLYLGEDSGEVWKNKDGKNLFKIVNEEYTKLKITLEKDVLWNTDKNRPKSLYYLNKEYLDSIRIFSLKALVTYFIDVLSGGVPNYLMFNLSISNTTIQGMVDNIIKNVMESDDGEINDCFATFSNEDWINALQENELKKYSGAMTDTKEVVYVNANSVIEDLTKASSAGTMYDQKVALTKTVADITTTAATDATGEVGIGFNYSPSIANIATVLLYPFTRCLFTPKVLALYMMNLQAAGLVDLTNVESLDVVLEIIKKKMLAIIKQLAKKLVDMITNLLFNLVAKYLTPLIAEVGLKKIQEQLTEYTTLLEEALECIKLFHFNFGSANTEIDDVNYADITPEKITPTQTIC